MEYRKSPIPYVAFGFTGRDFEYSATDQMTTAMRIPVAVRGAMMPDAHKGYGLPIGGVIELDHAVSPNFVGYDIACRMMLSIIDIEVDDFMKRRELIARDMLAVTSFGKGCGFDRKREHKVIDEPLWKELPHLKKLRAVAEYQLGSSGSGNHFFNAMLGQVRKEVDWLPLTKGTYFIAIMTHSGSRGVGHKVASHYIKLAKQETRLIAKGIPNDYEWLSTKSDLGREYLRVMRLMGRYAHANHALIHDHFLNKANLVHIARYENHHNFAWEQENGNVIHRKGATPAGKGQIGIIPGSSGSASYLVEGLGDKDSLDSSSHGAGRKFSRSQAKEEYDADKANARREKLDVLHFGIAKDETFMAYKDIEHVMKLQKSMVKPIAKMQPKIVIMGGKR